MHRVDGPEIGEDLPILTERFRLRRAGACRPRSAFGAQGQTDNDGVGSDGVPGFLRWLFVIAPLEPVDEWPRKRKAPDRRERNSAA